MARERPYFIWDHDISVAQFRAMLNGENEADTAWAIARLLEAARWDDIWQYVTLEHIRLPCKLIWCATLTRSLASTNGMAG